MTQTLNRFLAFFAIVALLCVGACSSTAITNEGKVSDGNAKPTSVVADTSWVLGERLPARCLKRGETGRCRAYFIRFAYNPNKKQCEEFVYGGCGEAPFETLQACQALCEKK